MLSPLQQRVALIVAELPEAEGFALAGGGALVARGDIDRPTRDLDYFATRPERVQEALPHVIEALQRAGLSVTVERSSAGFVRLTVGDGSATTELDLASDYRLLPVEPSDFGRTLAAEELAIDKVLAIFDRAEPRDFADLAAGRRPVGPRSPPRPSEGQGRWLRRPALRPTARPRRDLRR